MTLIAYGHHCCICCLKVLFIYVDIDDEDNLRILEFFGMKVSECPAVRYITLGDDMVKYRPDSTELTSDYILQFVKDVRNGNLKVLTFSLLI